MFSQNLNFLRTIAQESQTETALLLGLKRTTYINYEKGNNEPDLQLLVKISDHYQISIDDLLRVNISKGKLLPEKLTGKNLEKGKVIGKPIGKLTAEKEQNSAIEEAITEPEMIYGNGHFNIYDLDSRAAAGSALLLLEEDKRKTPPNAYLPGLGLGLHIRLPIVGDSMHPTIKDGDRPVGTWVQDLAELRQGWLHIIIDAEEGIVCKRVYLHDKETLELVSDNELYKPYNRPLSSVLALFRVRENHSTDLRPFMNDVRAEMREVRQDIADLKRLIKVAGLNEPLKGN